MAELEAQLFASGLPVEALMEKAALALSRRLLELPIAAGVLVLVGPGHNGGDGLVIARELHLAGVPVRLWCPFERRRPLTECHWRHAGWLGISILEHHPDPGDPTLWIDALFGIGQKRPPGEGLELLLEERQRRRPGSLIAIDVPTGLCADSGCLLGAGGATAALTLTVGLIKRGLVQDIALARVGQLERIDLGLPEMLLSALAPEVPLGLGQGDIGQAPAAALNPAAAKYDRGRLLLVAGSQRYRGAAALALSGASASGCGSIRAALPREVAESIWQSQPHVVVETALPATMDGGLNLAPLADGDWSRLDAIVLGPGLGSGPGRASSVEPEDEGATWGRLQTFAGLLLLDADGLNRLVAASSSAAATWLQGRRGPSWITPHRGEFNRLFPDLSDLEPLEAAGAAARRSGAAVLLKGARSVVAAPDGRRWQLLDAAADAARAGLGDVLAGYAAGRGALACSSSAVGAADGDAAHLAAAALAHALAGCHCRRQEGPGGVTPMAVARQLALSGQRAG